MKSGVRFSTLWSETFADEFFQHGLDEWLNTGFIAHDLSHVRALEPDQLPPSAQQAGSRLANDLRHRKAILGIFDEGCMGMYNAIIDDELLNPIGIYKERLSQSALAARMATVSDTDALGVRAWLDQAGVRFNTGTDEATQLTDRQILGQCRMYIAATRMAAEFGCDAIGIQYQQGLKDTVPASDLAEGMLNNRERPPVFDESGQTELFAGQPLPHFNEVDEGAAVDALVTNRCWNALGFDPSTTLHDLRWGAPTAVDGGTAFVWVLQISGAAPANHFAGGYRGAQSDRQPPMYFPLGGGTLKGIGKPGEIVWSRVFVEGGALCVDLGRGSVVTLPRAGSDVALEPDHAAMAAGLNHLPWHQPRRLHGAPSRQPRLYRLRARCPGRRPRPSRSKPPPSSRWGCGSSFAAT